MKPPRALNGVIGGGDSMDITPIEIHLNFENVCSVVLVTFLLKGAINKMEKITSVLADN